MLNNAKLGTSQSSFEYEATPSSGPGLRWMFGAMFRFKGMIVAITLIAVALAAAFVLTRTATYTATAHLQLTNLRLTFSRDDAFFAEAQTDPSFIETQVQILRSERIALAVVDNLKLADQPRENNGGNLSGLIAELGLLFVSPPPDAGVVGTMTDARAEAVKMIRRGLSVDRITLSNVVELKFTAPTAEAAARITNDVIRAYIADQNAARIDAAQAGSSWLRERLREVGPKTRIIAAALPPTDKSNVRGILIIVVVGILGGALSIVLALVRAFLDGSVRTPEQAMEATGSPFIGLAPVMRALKVRPRSRRSKLSLPAGEFQIPPANFRALADKNSELSHTLKNVKFLSDEQLRENQFQAIGVTSIIRGEGCTAISINLALSLVAARKRTLLIDGDVYSADLSKRLGLGAPSGLAEQVAENSADLGQYVKVDQATGLHVLPLAALRAAKTPDWPEHLSAFIADARDRYDYAIFDLPPVTMLNDIRAAARFIDGFVVVIKWGEVGIEQIQAGLSMAYLGQSKILGCIINKINLRRMRWMPSRELDFIRLRKKAA